MTEAGTDKDADDLRSDELHMSVIVPTYAGSVSRNKCLKSVSRAYEELRGYGLIGETITVLDNTRLLAEKRNLGASAAKGEFLLFVDDDNVITSAMIMYMVKTLLAFGNIGIVGAVAVYSTDEERVADSGSFRHYVSGFTMDMFVNKDVCRLPRHNYRVHEVANVFMMRRSLFHQVNGFDAERFPVDLDEADLCARVSDAGYRVVMCPDAITIHNSQTFSRRPAFRRNMNAFFMGRNKVFYQRRHAGGWRFLVYCLVFLPITVFGYWYCLRGQPGKFRHFFRGIRYGLSNYSRVPEIYKHWR